MWDRESDADITATAVPVSGVDADVDGFVGVGERADPASDGDRVVARQGDRVDATADSAKGLALVGLAACIMMPLFSVFPTVGLNFVLIAFVIVVLGGMGSIEGALLGGICIGVVQSLSSYYVAPAYGQMFYFILFLLVMIFRPNGLLGQKGAATIGIND